MVTLQLKIFLLAIGFGVVIGVIYDLLRILRRGINHSYFFIGVEDVGFFFLVAVTSFRFMLEVLEGKVRLFILLGEVLGWLIYFFTLSPYVMQLGDWIFAVVKGVCTIIYRVISFPLRKTLGILNVIRKKYKNTL